MSGKAEQKSFATPDETRTFDYGALDLLHTWPERCTS
jgi:hypothetical protein